ncbi:YIP1 family protein [Sulfitobacter noctilucicola]|uniref:Yip1 domain-containing protein n=1 Tax=Sulfitobacter noctilucicola TaxID=1342301 RepID=A0A7W6Q3N3_9RHOB|nr:YIP1 family protein [Sulfitobacter noctilucicola]MBB4173798.1 hypothetical protein [Sulfitobacter noctilucicola]
MIQETMIPLARLTLEDPRSAARQVMAMDLSRDALWTALALVAIVNTFLVTLLMTVSAPTMPMPTYMERPLALFVLIAGLMVVYVHAMYWAGLTIGGKGRLMDVLALVVWFQILRAAAQLAIVVLSLALPAAGLLLSLVVAVWGLWIFMNFLATALNLKSPWHSIAVMAVAFVGLVFGMGILAGLIGGIAQGGAS